MIDIKNYRNEDWRQLPLHIRKFSTNQEKEELMRLLEIVYFRYMDNPDDCSNWFSPNQINADMDNDLSIFITLIDDFGVIYAIASIDSVIPITDPKSKTVHLNSFCSLWPKDNNELWAAQNVDEIIDPWNRGMTRRSIMEDGRKTPLGRTLILRIIDDLRQYNVYSIIAFAIREADNFWFSLPEVERIPPEQFITSPEIDYWPHLGFYALAEDLDINMRIKLR
tara:strand:+ start:75 stop:743 length:669 start_codon:yes stop_codon:yes gene_type:complete